MRRLCDYTLGLKIFVFSFFINHIHRFEDFLDFVCGGGLGEGGDVDYHPAGHLLRVKMDRWIDGWIDGLIDILIEG